MFCRKKRIQLTLFFLLIIVIIICKVCKLDFEIGDCVNCVKKARDTLAKEEIEAERVAARKGERREATPRTEGPARRAIESH